MRRYIVEEVELEGVELGKSFITCEYCCFRSAGNCAIIDSDAIDCSRNTYFKLTEETQNEN